MTYNLFDFLVDGAFGSVNGGCCSNQTNLPSDVSSGSLRHVDLASGLVLHLSNCLAAFADNHADCFGGYMNGFVQLVVVV